ncbi:hypothetical protein DMUE_4894 [Dictyocoela muelleri]|nr:hypothetical protein DMUE_4894 [Dictyocoela muelleri]
MIGFIGFSNETKKSKRINGEAELVEMNVVENFLETYKQKMSEYEDKDIFNCDESSLMYKQPFKCTYTLSEKDKANGKFAKDRVTILLAVSKAGENLNHV